MGGSDNNNKYCVKADSTFYESKEEINQEAGEYLLDNGHKYVKFISKETNKWIHNPPKKPRENLYFKRWTISDGGAISHISHKDQGKTLGSQNISTKNNSHQCNTCDFRL